ncbi:MAG: Bifunctional (P)ppGpp synthetase/guanosine-3',5'-bis(Diphosphate) 3'-pyrophosphohydrolase [uncultured Campylobacterales bacterium]|uniref:Bifunctional (P)ppGpp synthetase/guanosine-3',5'-bis(Diphosphate) 3'-pyrophosphohydrolase n=1 Tax=uncultured Campylobacterales bacterium TaxID=352960 RepID=A0A6S6SK30_9BACT|nr:MAG: Bifunctional (P)ppGpp synthetase/guanosine-3',5'-bis(Diphosphate) 3'-pyrophosphohydrolase [uncultured Campylobacterales bacterium]
MNKEMQTSQWEHYFNSLKTILKNKPNIDIDLIQKAFYFAGDAHSSQYRRSGEPYIMHPTAVAKIVAEQGLGIESIIAALLHDTVEDTKVTLQDIVDTFGEDVGFLVDSLSHFDNTLNKTDKRDVQTLRKILFSMSKDFRTVYIKIADRLHNMSTLKHMPPEKQIQKATETQEIYIGLAKNLNLWEWKTDLENYCLKYLDPKKYKNYNTKIKIANKKDEKINDIVKILQDTLNSDYILSVIPHKYSVKEVAQKFPRENSFIDINNTYFIEVVSKEDKAYHNLRTLHQKFKSFDTRFKDYISKPKENGYNALHTTIFSTFGLIDIKIKNEDSFANSQKHNQEQWVEKILIREKNLKDDDTFHNSVVNEVLSKSIKVYSSFGEEIRIPKNSTTLDFLLLLYGKKGLLVNDLYIEDTTVGLDFVLSHKDIIEVNFLSEKRAIRLEWFEMLTSYEAKQVLIDELGGEQNFDSLFKGYEEFKPWMKIFQISNLEYIYINFEKHLPKNKYTTFEDVLIALGKNLITIKEVLLLIIPLNIFRKTPRSEVFKFALLINNTPSPKISVLFKILECNLKEYLPIYIQDDYYIAIYEDSLKVKYYFKNLENLISSIEAIKTDISQDLQIRYIL